MSSKESRGKELVKTNICPGCGCCVCDCHKPKKMSGTKKALIAGAIIIGLGMLSGKK